MDENIYVQPDSVLLGNGTFDPNQYTHYYPTDTPDQLQYQPVDETGTMSQHHPASTADDSNSRQAHTIATTSSLDIRTSMPAVTGILPLQTAGFSFSQAYNPSAAMLTTNELSFGLQSYNSQDMSQMSFNGAYGMPLQHSPIDDLVSQQEQIHNNSMDSSYMQQAFQMNNVQDLPYQQFQDLNNLLVTGNFNAMTSAQFPNSLSSVSPPENWIDLERSLSRSSENSWSWIPNNIVNPMNLEHNRTYSNGSNSSQDSDTPPLSARSISDGYLEIFQPSPEPEVHDHHDHCDHTHSHHGLPILSPIITQHHSPPALISTAPSTTAVSSPDSLGTSPTSSAAGSPKTKRRNSPISPAGVTSKTIAKKKVTLVVKEKSEKKVGKRKGPLRPEQRQQAHEIRKLRACLRCKFLKKVCDSGDTCSGCKPSHARLWQVPCTRLAIQDIAYFLKGWNADYERHVTMQVSIANIKGFSPYNRELYITHGYGYMFRVKVREVYLHDDKDMGVDWTESIHVKPRNFEVQTARLAADMDGISRHQLSQYVEQHLYTFEKFVDDYFEATPFLIEMLKTIYRHYVRTQSLTIKKGLKLVIAYALTLHVTMVHPETQEDYRLGMIDNEGSRWYGQIASPIMINFQVKKAMAELWREYMKDVLEELSQLYSSVYSGDKLKNWPTIFMLACLILAVWEMMQFDQNYRVPDKDAVEKFCDEMENVPVGVIVGLFSAISTKLPTFLEWDTSKHSHVLQDNQAVCDTMTEVRAHVEKHENYLRARSDSAVFDREDFDSLSNKFLSKLVIRAGAS